MAFTDDTLLVDWARLKALTPAVQVAALHSSETFAEACVSAAQGALEAWLGCPPFVHMVSQPVTAWERPWDLHNRATGYYGTYATDRPASVARDSGVTVTDGKVLTYRATPSVRAFSYFAGWRRDGQDEADLNAALGLSGDDAVTAGEVADIPAVPADVEMALAASAEAYASVVGSGALGVTSRTQDWGQSQTTTQAVRFDHLTAPFHTLARYRVPRV